MITSIGSGLLRTHSCRIRRVFLYLISVLFILTTSFFFLRTPPPRLHIEEALSLWTDKPVICVLVLVCNRPSVKVNLDSIFKHRRNTPSVTFPVIVSQDCGHHKETTEVVQSYGSDLVHLFHPDQSEISNPNPSIPVGYYKQTRHHRWALTQAFNHYQCPHVITLEDDLEVSPDFFEYFAGLLPLYQADKTIYCVTASNLQAKATNVDVSEKGQALLHRTDFFFGWGWMISRYVFDTVIGKWPKTYWDVYMGLESTRAQRSCIRPEIPRIRNFGRHGTSGTDFYDKYIKDLLYSENFTSFTTMNFNHLFKKNYDRHLTVQVAESILIPNLDAVQDFISRPGISPKTTFKLVYQNQEEFVQFGAYFRLHTETWNHVAHTEYQGILTCFYKGHRFYLVPGRDFIKSDKFQDTNSS